MGWVGDSKLVNGRIAAAREGALVCSDINLTVNMLNLKMACPLSSSPQHFMLKPATQEFVNFYLQKCDLT